jgi:hypothetical protein
LSATARHACPPSTNIPPTTPPSQLRFPARQQGTGPRRHVVRRGAGGRMAGSAVRGSRRSRCGSTSEYGGTARRSERQRARTGAGRASPRGPGAKRRASPCGEARRADSSRGPHRGVWGIGFYPPQKNTDNTEWPPWAVAVAENAPTGADRQGRSRSGSPGLPRDETRLSR